MGHQPRSDNDGREKFFFILSYFSSTHYIYSLRIYKSNSNRFSTTPTTPGSAHVYHLFVTNSITTPNTVRVRARVCKTVLGCSRRRFLVFKFSALGFLLSSFVDGSKLPLFRFVGSSTPQVSTFMIKSPHRLTHTHTHTRARAYK